MIKQLLFQLAYIAFMAVWVVYDNESAYNVIAFIEVVGSVLSLFILNKTVAESISEKSAKALKNKPMTIFINSLNLVYAIVFAYYGRFFIASCVVWQMIARAVLVENLKRLEDET